MLQQAQLEQYYELIAALKLRTTNKQGRHLSTRRAIELLVDYGVATQQGLVKAPKPTEIKALFHNMLDPAPMVAAPTSSSTQSSTVELLMPTGSG